MSFTYFTYFTYFFRSQRQLLRLLALGLIDELPQLSGSLAVLVSEGGALRQPPDTQVTTTYEAAVEEELFTSRNE